MGKVNTTYDTHFLEHHYGIVRPIPEEQRVAIGKAILAVAGGDGDLTHMEMNYFLGLQRGLGATQEMLEQWQKFDYRGVRMTDLVTKELEPWSRIILYDALRVARADGVGQKERDAAVRMAKVLKIDPTHVSAIEGMLGIEDALTAARIRVLSPVQ